MFRHPEHIMARVALYIPGDRPDRIRKCVELGVDAAVVDLEDAVAPDAKPEARQQLAQFLDELQGEVTSQIHVRCNRRGDGWEPDDFDVAVHPRVSVLRLAKADEPEAIRQASAAVTALEAARGIPQGSVRFDLLIESALGVVNAFELATADPRVRQLCLGAADLADDLGIDRDSSGVDPLLLTRQHLVLASRAAGRHGPMDTVCTDIDNEDRVHLEAAAARKLGFTGKSVIHPRQIEPVLRAFAPTEAEIEWATRVQAAWVDALASSSATTVVDGEFVDAPVAARAERVLADALKTTVFEPTTLDSTNLDPKGVM